MDQKLLDLSMFSTSDEVRQAAEAHWIETHPVPAEPERPPLFRPAVITTVEEGRLWFEVTYERSEASLHLRTFTLKNDERLSLDEAEALQDQLSSAVEAYRVLRTYAKERKAWKEAIDQRSRDLGLYLNATVQTWAGLQKKK